ncbi:MAG: hypothetical protein KME47_09865 [Nodosilinea sp. WJT8-NPBG4]|jgi:hypothetical protein|nr:hypothetical protein [Nodosilinea sp. WJT8-NPBG4]
MSVKETADKIKSKYGSKSNMPSYAQVLSELKIGLGEYLLAVEWLGWD